jgi:hypothetical protein
MPGDISLDNIEDDSYPNPPAPSEAADTPTPPPTSAKASDENDEEQPEPVKPATPEPEPPGDLKAAFQMLAEAQALPARTEAEKAAREKRLAFARKHVARLQEGLPTLPMDATMFAHAFQAQVRSLNRERLEILSREHREVAELLAERDRLEIAKLKARN